MAPNRFIMAVVFLVLTATVANAYTLVMRNGRRVDIPNEFTVTASTLTYTVGSGIQIVLHPDPVPHSTQFLHRDISHG